MHLLVTRPEPAARHLSEALRALGHEVTAAPLMTILRLPAAPELAGVQALAFTSANGVEAFAALTAARDLPVFAVGAATAKAARARGFQEVHRAEGDGQALAALIAARLDPRAGAVFHGAGRHVAHDLAQALAPAGIEVRRQALYEARAEPRLPEAAARALAGKSAPPDGVLLFSPRSAQLFEKLTAEAGLADQLGPVTAFCLSPAVAAALTQGRWRRIAVAAAPNQAALLSLLPRNAAAGQSLEKNLPLKGGGRAG